METLHLSSKRQLAGPRDRVVAEVVPELVLAVGGGDHLRPERRAHVRAAAHKGGVDVDRLAADGREAPVPLPSARPGREAVAAAAPAKADVRAASRREPRTLRPTMTAKLRNPTHYRQH